VAKNSGGDEVKPVRGSSENERRWRGGATEGARKLESDGRRCGGGWAWRCPFIGAEGGLRRRQRVAVNGVNAINGGVGLRGD
jgi:hypothetical protein